VAELDRLLKAAPALREKTEKLSDQLISESYGDEIRDALKILQSQVNDFAFDRTRHEQVKRELAELLPRSELFRDLQRALNEEPNLRQSTFSCAEMIANKQEQKLLLEQEIEEIEALLQQMPGLQALLAQKQMEVQELALKRDEHIKTVAVAESSVHRLAGELAELDQRCNELIHVRHELDDYLFLADAFGKKGIQAVIIENAIPEIETEANKILSRLSENKMHIGLVTQYKTKSGSLNETLDLLIGDEIGTRNYELFSGGEAFKVNFAIRVALSKLLARRSGARLETLIIDEGFGSQDEASRERLVRAIRAIRTDFARILVITHMADIREMFPIQIQVKKVNGSSRLQFA
jgi:exonuclease SbcC